VQASFQLVIPSFGGTTEKHCPDRQTASLAIRTMFLLKALHMRGFLLSQE
jgi:hypothetical protein